MTNSVTQFLFPPDKPKSLILFVLALLSVYLIGGPLILLGAWLEIGFITNLGVALCTVFLVVSLPMGIIHFSGRITGRYRGLKSRAWREQVW
jgi:hypothetical protein